MWLDSDFGLFFCYNLSWFSNASFKKLVVIIFLPQHLESRFEAPRGQLHKWITRTTVATEMNELNAPNDIGNVLWFKGKNPILSIEGS
jgi:hypothetical protein